MVKLLATEAALQKHFADGSNLAGVRAAVAVYSLLAFCFTSTLECTGFLYGCEIWPTHLRRKGATVSYIGFYSFCIWTTAPAAQALKTIGWKYLMVSLSITIVLLIPVMFYLPGVRLPIPNNSCLPFPHLSTTPT